MEGGFYTVLADRALPDHRDAMAHLQAANEGQNRQTVGDLVLSCAAAEDGQQVLGLDCRYGVYSMRKWHYCIWAVILKQMVASNVSKCNSYKATASWALMIISIK